MKKDVFVLNNIFVSRLFVCKAVFLGLLVGMFLACGPDIKVGEGCKTDSDCIAPNSCITSMPGGYCSHSCDKQGFSCGGGGGKASYCTMNGGAMRCSVNCIRESDCRTGYTCTDVPGTNNPAMLIPTKYKACVKK